MNNKALVNIENLKKYFPIKSGVFTRTKGYVKAVDDISFSIGKSEIVGMVGESGCGKTTLGKTILLLTRPNSGNINFDGNTILSLDKDNMRKIRRHMQIIFQNPYSSLNPRMTVGEAIGEGLKLHRLANRKDQKSKVKDILERVGLPYSHIDKYPHEMSGGQMQRVAIARAIILEPKFIVCDEPVSALDVSIQSQVLNLLIELKEELNLSYLFISHDLSVVEYISDRVMVMYLGKIMESAMSDELYKDPKHPYTIALMNAVPVAEPIHKRDRILIPGDPPSPINPPEGCRFHPRCPEAMDICRKFIPETKNITVSHFVNCHLFN